MADEYKPKIRTIVVDDHPLVRDSLSILMSSQTDIEVIATCDNAEKAAEVIRAERPDVCVSDIEMPGRSPFDIAKDLQQTSPDTRFVYLTAFLTDAHLVEALKQPVTGYLVKSAGIPLIAEAIRSVAGGISFFCADTRKRLAQMAGTSRIGRLTTREKEVLRAVASDLSSKEIAVRLGLSARTVERHKANIMEKLGIHSQVGLTRFAVAEGLLDPRSAANPAASS